MRVEYEELDEEMQAQADAKRKEINCTCDPHYHVEMVGAVLQHNELILYEGLAMCHSVQCYSQGRNN